MDTKYIKMLHKLVNTRIFATLYSYIINFHKRGGNYMFKFLAKMAEKYAKSTNTACFMVFVMHQPKMPASLIKKD